jgi:hypothetical protein
MALKKEGNLGQVELMIRLLSQKAMEGYDKETPVTLNKEEYEYLQQMLSDFKNVLANLLMWENSLKDDQYGGLISVIEEIKKKDLY